MVASNDICSNLFDTAYDLRDVRTTPPAPRLVGVEPNPGPPKQRTKGAKSSTTTALATFGQLLGSGGLKALMPPRMKSRRAPKRQAAAASSMSLAPSAISFNQRYFHGPDTHTVRFFTNALRIGASSDYAGAYFTRSDLGAGPGSDNIIVSLTNGPAANDFSGLIFGNNVSEQARLYVRWRIKRLRMFFVPNTPTSRAGRIALACDPDAAGYQDGPNAALSAAYIQQYRDNMSGSVWSAFEVPCTSLYEDKRWFYTADYQNEGNPDDAELRNYAPGAIAVSQLGLTLGAPVLEGSVAFEGEVEFRNLRPQLQYASDGSSALKASPAAFFAHLVVPTVDDTHPAGTSASAITYPGSDPSVSVVTDDSLLLPNIAAYTVTLTLIGKSSGYVPVLTAGAGTTISNVVRTDTSTTTNWRARVVIDTAGVGGIVFSGVPALATAASWDMLVEIL
jgi:hypothetical protein